jgi:amino-acid N-acetyltransferase
MTGDDSGPIPDFVRWFRNSSPYINAHKGRCFVLALNGESIDGPQFDGLVHDIALLATLGVRMVLVHGARPQLEARLTERQIESRIVAGRRVTDRTVLEQLLEVCGVLRARIEARLSMDLANSPMHGARLRVSAGNHVTARPLGVLEGVDHRFTGRVRRVDVDGIEGQLAAGSIVLLSPIGYSPTGEIYSLAAEELAVDVAVALRAAKLILFRDGLLLDTSGQPLRELMPAEAERLLARGAECGALSAAIRACREGVPRCHLLDYRADGALLQELYSRDGCGTLLNETPFETLRQAGLDDLGGIMELLTPLEQQGILVRRSRERLEMEIGNFYVTLRDGAIIACAALFPDASQGSGEIAALATDPDYRRGGRAERLLQHLERLAEQQGLRRLFVLTTVSGEWFEQRGYRRVDRSELPPTRLALYNEQRNSLVYLKALSAAAR